MIVKNLTTSEPKAPRVGDTVLNSAAGVSSASGQPVLANHVYAWNGSAWEPRMPQAGDLSFDPVAGTLRGYNGAAWLSLGTFANLKDITDGGDAAALHSHALAKGATDVTASAAEVNRVCDNAAATSTAANLNTLTGGAVSNADALHTHAIAGLRVQAVKDILDFTAAEPAGPAEGDRYLNSGTGDSSATAQAVTADRLYTWNGADWTETTPTAGQVIYDEDSNALLGYEAAWIALGTFANIKDITDGGNADALHIHAFAGMADAVQDAIPSVAVTASVEVAHARDITVQLKDAAGNNLAEQRLVRVMVNPTAALGAPAATGTDTFGAPSAGAIYQTVTAKADYWALTDNTGKYVFSLTHNDAGTSRWVAVAVGSKVVSSAELAFDAV
jgi:hypothetical protein